MVAGQRETVRPVEERFTLADQLDARYAKAKAHVENLTPSGPDTRLSAFSAPLSCHSLSDGGFA